MSEIIERMARALADDRWAVIGGADGETRPGEPHWTLWTSAARAALAAIREPTCAMLAVSAIEYTMPAGEPMVTTDPALNAGIWRAMVDEALR